jgi:DNA helicase-2/ATP-dependent DNA helicase PcrA
MGTFHSIFSRILRREAERLGYSSSFTIYDATDTKSLLKRIIKDMSLDDKTYKPTTVYSRISFAKNNLITPPVYANSNQLLAADRFLKIERTVEIYQEYMKRCKKADAMDFDDLLLNTNILFRDNPDVLDKYRQKFDFVLVDEYQDTNYSQYLIVKKLSEAHSNVCVVGDDAQSIYSFRGAKIENILNFQRDYPECKTYKLEQNYRSTQTIVDAANSVIEKNRDRLKKVSFSKNDIGEPIKIFKAKTENEEGYIVSSEINELVKNGSDFSDCAVLYRTNAQSRIFEQIFKHQEIPYRIFGGQSFYDRKEIKDVMGYLRLIINNKDDEAFRRIINYPARGIGNTTLLKIDTYAQATDKTMWEVVNNIEQTELGLNSGTIGKIKKFTDLINYFILEHKVKNAYDLTVDLVKKSGILNDLDPAVNPENIARHENIEELLNSIKESVDSYDTEETTYTITDYMEEVSLLTGEESNDPDNDNYVSLMTIHSAKGLEFKNVFIVGVEENLFPSFRSVESPKDLEEERRLFYVALTRAESAAFISFAELRRKWGEETNCCPSRFIKDIDKSFVQLQYDEMDNFSEIPGNSGFRNKKVFEKSGGVTEKSEPAFRMPKREKTVIKRDEAGFEIRFDIRPGMRVCHLSFGEGKVLKVEGEAPESKATIFFEGKGQKFLLLKFAKLKVLN